MFLIRIIGKIRKLLTKKQKYEAIGLGVLMIIGALLEMLSVSLIMPFVQMVISSEEMNKNEMVLMVCNLIKVQPGRQFLIYLAVVLAIIYIIKNVFLLFQFNMQYKFVYSGQFSLQKQLLHKFINRNYEFFLTVDTGEIIRLITGDTLTAFYLLQNFMVLVSEGIVFAAIIVTVFIISPVVTISMAILLFMMSIVILKIIRPILKRSSIKQKRALASMNKWLIQSIRGIKEVKIMHKESFFEEEYCKNGPIFVKTNRMNTTLGQIPRFMIEGISLSAFFIVVAIIISKDFEKVSSVLPIMSVVAVAAIRILPSVSRISQSLAQISSAEPYLDIVLENMKTFDMQETKVVQRNKSVVGFKDKIELQDISYVYPTGDRKVLNHANLVIRRGESIGILGASGAGKSTTIDILLGLLVANQGNVLVDGIDIKNDINGWLSQIGYIPQSIFLLDGSIRDNVAFGIDKKEIDDERVWQALRDAALEEFVIGLPQNIHSEIGEAGVRLSGGQRQRIGIARALYTSPEILVFDEATSALDSGTEAAIMDSFNRLQGKKTMIIISHRLSTIENCDSLYKVENGVIEKIR